MTCATPHERMKPLILLQSKLSLFEASTWGASYIPVIEGRPPCFWEGCGLHLDTMAKGMRMSFEREREKGILTRGRALLG